MKKKIVHEFIYLVKKNGGELCLPHPPSGLRPWTPHALGWRTLASLVGVNGMFAKISYRFFRTKKKLFNSGQIFRKHAHCSENYFIVQELFCATLGFWDIVDFLYGWFCIHAVAYMGITGGGTGGMVPHFFDPGDRLSFVPPLFEII